MPSPGLREVSQRCHMSDGRCEWDYAGLGHGGLSLWKVSHQEVEQTVSCSVAALQLTTDLYKGFMISSTPWVYFLKPVLNQKSDARAVKSEPEE